MTYIITIERKGYRFDIELQSPTKADAIRAVIEGFRKDPDPDSKLIAIKEQA
jgi:DNA-binding winged helix-turn-helix (wHTH) protein